MAVQTPAFPSAFFTPATSPLFRLMGTRSAAQACAGVYISQKAALAAMGWGGPAGACFAAVSALGVSVVLAGSEEQAARAIETATIAAWQRRFFMARLQARPTFYARGDPQSSGYRKN